MYRLYIVNKIHCSKKFVKCIEFYMDKKEILKEFGRNLKAERNRAGLSQEQLAEKIGLSYGQVIGTIERGETNTSLSVIVSIMNVLDLDFEKLFDRKLIK